MPLAIVFLILVNLIPIAGVLYLDWNLFEIVMLYWLENLIVGAINVLKMMACSPDAATLEAAGDAEQRTNVSEKDFSEQSSLAQHASKIFFIPFFIIHYGMFCFVHGMFVFFLLGPRRINFSQGGPFEELGALVREVTKDGGIWFALCVFVSHLISFATNYIGKREYQHTTLDQLMNAPYGRIVVLHIAILFGAFAIESLGSTTPLLLILIGGKTALDLFFHRRQHRELQEHAI